MADLRTNVLVNLAGNLTSNAKSYSRALGQFASRGQQQLSGLRRGADLAFRGIDRLGNRFTALATGAGGIGALRYVTTLSARLTTIGIAAGAADKDIEKLKKQIFAVAKAPDIKLDPSAIITAVEEILERTGDFQFVEENIRNIGIALRGTGAEGSAVGGVFAEFQKTGIRSMEDVLQTIDTLNVQGKAGAFTFRNLAAQGPAVVQAYAALGRQGPQAMRELGAALQIIEKGVGSPAETATVFERLLDTFKETEKLKMLTGAGIKVWDQEALDNGKRKLRPITELMTEISETAKGDQTILGQLFDVRALRAFNILSAEIQNTGRVQSIEQFMNVVADGTVTLNDSARRAAEADASWTNLLTTFKELADSNLSKPIKDLSSAVDSLGTERLDAIVSRLVKAGLVLGGIVIALKATRLIAGTIGAVRGARGGGAGGLGGSLGGMTPVPVIIVGGLPGMGGGSGGYVGGGGYSSAKSLGGTAAARGGRLARFARGGSRLMGRLGGPLALLTGGAMLASTLMDSEKSNTAKVVDSASIVGGVGGGLAGAKIGAVIGTMIAPGIGTAIGAALGGAGGWLAGEFAGRKSAEHFTAADIGREVAKAIDGKTDVNIKIDAEGRASTTVGSGRNRRNVNVDTGVMMQTP